jgi:hypothetical protein
MTGFSLRSSVTPVVKKTGQAKNGIFPQAMRFANG